MTTAKRLSFAALLSATFALAPTLSTAQEANNLEQVASWLEQGVNSAFLTQEQADIMLAALKRSSAVSREVAIDVSQASRSPVSFDRAAFEKIMQQFSTGQITAEQANEQARALGLLNEGASLMFTTQAPGDGTATGQIRSFTLIQQPDSDLMESKQIRIITTGVETEASE